MNRKDAKIIAEIISNAQLARMFQRASEQITDWRAVSAVNKGLTKGAAWNILTKAFEAEGKLRPIAKLNMVMEFGDLIRSEFKLNSAKTKPKITPHHEDPVFSAGQFK